MGCRPSRSSLSRVADSTCEYNRCYMKEFDVARRKQKKSHRHNRRNMPTYNNFSSTTKVYDRSSGTSKITVRLSTDGSMLEIEQFDVEYDSAEIPEVAENVDDDQGIVMKSVSELKTQRLCGDIKRYDSAPQLSDSSESNRSTRSTKKPSCGLVGCCIQNRTDSVTMCEEYRPKTGSTVECMNDEKVEVEHNCEVHRDCVPTKTINDDKSLDSDSLNDSSPRRYQPQSLNDEDENTRITTKISDKSESDCQTTNSLLKRSSLEPQMKASCVNGVESHLHHCSTFKPILKHEDIEGHSGSLAIRKIIHNNCCKASTLCHKECSSVEICTEIPRQSFHSKSMTLGVNDKNMNKTEGYVINNPDRRLDNQIAENNQLGKICSACNNSKYISEMCDCCCINSGCGGCQNASCPTSETITNDNKNKCSLSKFNSSCGGRLNFDLCACCCCFTKYNNSGENGPQCFLYSHYRNLNQSADTGKNNDSIQITPIGDPNNGKEELLDSERQSLIDHHKDTAYDKKTAYSLNCTHRSNECFQNITDSDLTSFSTNLDKVNQKLCRDNQLDLLTHSGSDCKYHTNNIEFGARYGRELVSQRPCVPNKTATRDLDIKEYSQCIQESITVTSDRREHECQEHFTISKGVVCVHNIIETTDVRKLKPASVISREVSRTSFNSDGRPCINSQPLGSSGRERCCDDFSNSVDNHVYQDSCCCHKRSFVEASEEYRLTDFYEDIDEPSKSDYDIPTNIDQRKRYSETFPFCEYESFVVKEKDTPEDGEDGTECNKPLVAENVVDSISTDNSDSSDDDGDFDCDSSDECRDEYVDALETTYV